MGGPGLGEGGRGRLRAEGHPGRSECESPQHVVLAPLSGPSLSLPSVKPGDRVPLEACPQGLAPARSRACCQVTLRGEPVSLSSPHAACTRLPPATPPPRQALCQVPERGQGWARCSGRGSLTCEQTAALSGDRCLPRRAAPVPGPQAGRRRRGSERTQHGHSVPPMTTHSLVFPIHRRLVLYGMPGTEEAPRRADPPSKGVRSSDGRTSPLPVSTVPGVRRGWWPGRPRWTPGAPLWPLTGPQPPAQPSGTGADSCGIESVGVRAGDRGCGEHPEVVSGLRQPVRESPAGTGRDQVPPQGLGQCLAHGRRCP